MMKICVFGAGNMGARIAEVFLNGGHDVKLFDIKQDFLDRGVSIIEKDLSFLVSREKITEADKAERLSRLSTTVNRKDACEAEFVMEVILERMDLKIDLLQELDGICPPHTIFASNTSGLSITEMAASIPHRADKFIGCHFFNPAQIMKLVEVVRAIQTSDETFQFAYDLMAALGKTPVAVDEGPGFVVNRMLIPMMNEAIGIYADGIASPADIDIAMQLGASMKSGPLHTADLVGHDVNLAIMENIYHETGDTKYRPHPLLRKMVRAGWLGVKTGKGFFDYDGPFGKEIIK
ncbi:3-hydroxyacyl-CoA dehydrogenase NAD-binding domain-containing protein [Agathobaculum sp. NTUH-O15-33]|uniref:3-hydroxyacyl-CoA dehydrogenase family protein n=1 Tax=Agathobaculum sp. NTUH-O15-33 TaxID=3079302 RepID=UPI002958D4FC|nr:3-hydroxyacyl-CoA dehydrogenase NAD-binding domain-containing protein [Agathobaculum sp. NTUH-O15-33]WNX86620.1 3-hydroxyacyl-CoA dehydrogenase NAD-binding domain-containing protein [Agathobaculum sp. NTUH-O15-33]